MIHAAIMGFGNIGTGVARVIDVNQDAIRRTLPEGMCVKYVLDIRDFPESPYGDRVVHDIDVIVNDPDISVVCETMGGKEPAFTFTKKALEKGISVCSSNKELVEAHGAELVALAMRHGCSYLFEASVGGGIPLISTMLRSLGQEKLDSITGILNGTTNYIFTKMEREGADYATVLREAQALGYAERDPAADVEGHDTGRKIAILASLMTGKTVRYEDAPVEGITRVTARDFAWAHAFGSTIKLLGRAARTDEGLQVLTAPHLVPETHALAMVNDVFNGVFLHGNMVDDVLLYGRGAGSLPTGSAVVADMIWAAKAKGTGVPVEWDAEVVSLVAEDAMKSRYMVRVEADERKLAEDAFEGLIADLKTDAVEGELAFITEEMPLSECRARLAALPSVMGCMRVLA
ncbi:MAG: homoserine dehydrogenase [Clostridiales bacterium]|nr:homoserine dehydrogenase [Clostridiales bacterium]